MATPTPEIQTQLIYDLETLGTTDGAVVLSFAAIVYHLVNDANKSIYQLIRNNSIEFKLDAKDQITRFKRTVDKSTLQWWSEQSASAQRVLKPTPEDLSLETFFQKLSEWCDEHDFVTAKSIAWQRGTIDCHWMDSLAHDIGLPKEERPIAWWRARDIRTAVDVLGYSSKFNGTPDNFYSKLKTEFPEKVDHDALHDCGAQVLQLRLCEVFPPPDFSDDEIPF